MAGLVLLHRGQSCSCSYTVHRCTDIIGVFFGALIVHKLVRFLSVLAGKQYMGGDCELCHFSIYVRFFLVLDVTNYMYKVQSDSRRSQRHLFPFTFFWTFCSNVWDFLGQCTQVISCTCRIFGLRGHRSLRPVSLSCNCVFDLFCWWEGYWS